MAQRVGRGIALLFHDRGTRRGWVVSCTPRPHFTPGKDPVPIVQGAGWAPETVWTGGKSRPHRDSIPDRPARSSVSIPTELSGPQLLHIIVWNALDKTFLIHKTTAAHTACVMWAFKWSQDQTDGAYDAVLACGHRFSVKQEMVYPVQFRWSASSNSHNRIVTLMILHSLVYLWQGREGEVFLHLHCNTSSHALYIQRYSKWLSGYNCPAATPYQIRVTTTIWQFHSKVVCTVSRDRVRVHPGTEGTNQNRHWNHHSWHTERTRLSCWYL